MENKAEQSDADDEAEQSADEQSADEQSADEQSADEQSEAEQSEAEQSEAEQSEAEQSDTVDSDIGDSSADSVSDTGDSVVSEANTTDTLKYISEKHGLKSNLSEYTNNKEDIDKIPIYICAFYSTTTIPTRPFVKFVVEKKEQKSGFPFDNDFVWSSVSSNEVVNEVDETLEDNFQKWCSDKITSWFIQDTPPKFEYQGFIDIDTNIFAFFELTDEYKFIDAAKYTYSIVDELAFYPALDETVSQFFEKNPNLRYYYDENDEKISPPHMGYKVDNMGVFPEEEGQYFATKGTEGRCAFFSDTTVCLLSNDMIEFFKEKRGTPEFIIQDYDSIFFRKDGNDYWFIPGGDNVVPL